MRVLDLFSGIGGFSLGLERAGMTTVAFCEIEPYPRKVLAKHWPGVPIYEDVRDVSKQRLDADGITGIDVITGGFPCQDISVAGKQAGIEGERSGLWGEVARTISELLPNYAIVENVSALLSGDRGGWFGRVLGDLAEIGYDCEWHCLPASYVGAWHRRERVWIIAYPAGDSQRLAKGPILGQRHIQVQSGGGFEEWPGRSNLPESRFRRKDDGVPARLDKGRNKGLGNAVVPQIPELIGRAIMS